MGFRRSAVQIPLEEKIRLAEVLGSHIKEDFKKTPKPEGAPTNQKKRLEFVNKILEVYPDAEMIWLEVPVEERKRRYEARGAAKDIEPFEVADNKPIELECQNIFSTFKDKLTIINNYGIN